MPASVVVFTRILCPYCDMARALLHQKGVKFREIDATNEVALRAWLVKASGQRTLPQVFVNGRSLGGFSDISALDDAGELDPLLASQASPTDPPLPI
ncbi:MAG: glutaredoxin domain-containing protein [Polyangiaceae bacterium]